MITHKTHETEVIIAKLNDHAFRKADTGLTYRALNHYQEENIICDNRNIQNAWRRFSGYDLIWIKVIEKLRQFGVRLHDIRKIRNNIFKDGALGIIDRASYINRSFEEEIAYSIIGKYSLYLVIFSDYLYTFHDSQSVGQWTIKSYKNDPHISIPLSKDILEVWRIITSKYH